MPHGANFVVAPVRIVLHRQKIDREETERGDPQTDIETSISLFLSHSPFAVRSRRVAHIARGAQLRRPHAINDSRPFASNGVASRRSHDTSHTLTSTKHAVETQKPERGSSSSVPRSAAQYIYCNSGVHIYIYIESNTDRHTLSLLLLSFAPIYYCRISLRVYLFMRTIHNMPADAAAPEQRHRTYNINDPHYYSSYTHLYTRRYIYTHICRNQQK